MKLNNNIYDILKWVVMLVLPTASTLYAALSAVWGWPLAQEITATIAAVTAALGALLGISTAEHYKTQDSVTSVTPVVPGPAAGPQTMDTADPTGDINVTGFLGGNEPSDQAYVNADYNGIM